MNNIKVSVIVPVYNVGKYLPECLNSLINQTLKEIEIICINDGSTDNSLEILNGYAQKDNRIKVINQENQGVSVARNVGIDLANGEYLMFLDGDDYLRCDACEIAYNSIKKDNSDICMFGYTVQVDDEFIDGRELKVLREYADKKEQLNLYSFYSSIDKIYKTTFLKDLNIKFIENLQTAEDLVFSSCVYFQKPMYSIIPESLYFYRFNRIGSLTTKNLGGIKSNLKALKVFSETNIFKSQPIELQLEVVDGFLVGCRFFYRKFKTLKEQLMIAKDIDETLHFLETIYSKKDLQTLKLYNQLKQRRLIAFLNFIFSMENSDDKKYKIITILGFRFQFLRSSKK